MSKNKNKKRFEVNANTNNNEDNKMDIQNNKESIENLGYVEPIEESAEYKEMLEEVIEEEAMENIGEIYRVRLDKDDPSTQIFISNNLDDCIEEAKKHLGYKVFNEDGNVRYENLGDIELEKDDKNTMYNYLLPSTGKLVVLKKVPVYRHPNDTKPYREANGKYYFYDYTIINDRAKITENANIATDPNRNPSMIYGYIDIKQKRN